MRVRLLVIVAFAFAWIVPAVLAYDVGLLHESDAGASLQPTAPEPGVVATLGWPRGPLGLAATSDMVVWERRGGDETERGLWAYDVSQKSERRIAPAAMTGVVTGSPSVSAGTVVWPARGADKVTSVRAFDIDVHRFFSPSRRGSVPVIGGPTAAWVRRDGQATGRDEIGVLDVVTGDRVLIPAGGQARRVAVWGAWVAWTARDAHRTELWALRYEEPGTRYLLGTGATSIAMDARRIVWSTGAKDGEAAVFAWDRMSGHSHRLGIVPGPVGDLTLSTDLIAWTRQTADGGDVWMCDLSSMTSRSVTQAAGRQASPVFAGDTLLWADHSGGHWELRARPLRP